MYIQELPVLLNGYNRMLKNKVLLKQIRLIEIKLYMYIYKVFSDSVISHGFRNPI